MPKLVSRCRIIALEVDDFTVTDTCPVADIHADHVDHEEVCPDAWASGRQADCIRDIGETVREQGEE